MKILQIHNAYQFRGGEDVVVEAEKRLLISQRNEVYSLLGNNKGISDIFTERKRFYDALKSIISDRNIDVAHIHNVYQIIGNGVYELLFSKKIPIVQTLHNFRFLCPAGMHIDNDNNICEICSKGNFQSCFKKKCYQNSYFKSFIMKELVHNGREKVLKNVNSFIALNNFYKQKYIDAGFPENKIYVKPNFINYQDNTYLSTKNNYALFIGRLSPEKGLISLINSFKNIPYKLIIAGTGNEEFIQQLKSASKNLSNIEFAGFVEGKEKDNLIQNCSFLIIPSIWYEAFGLVGLEAYSYSKPIIASNIGGLPDLVKHNQTGLLFEAGNVEALSVAVKAIIKNNWFIELGKNGYQFFKNNFTENQNYKQLMAIYNQAIDSQIND